MLVLSALLSASQCLHILPPSPYHQPDHVCDTFPFCFQDRTTGVWSSLPESSMIRSNTTNSLQKDVSEKSSACWFKDHYCRSDASNTLQKLSLDNPEACQAKCQALDECLFFTFHKTRGRGQCYLLSGCSTPFCCLMGFWCYDMPENPGPGELLK